MFPDNKNLDDLLFDVLTGNDLFAENSEIKLKDASLTVDPSDIDPRPFDEKRLLSLKARAYSIRYGLDLMRKYPEKFDFSEMIVNFRKFTTEINSNPEYIKNTEEAIYLILDEIYPKIKSRNEKNSILSVMSYFIAHDSPAFNATEEFIKYILDFAKKEIKNADTHINVRKIASAVATLKITEDLFFEYSDVLEFNIINTEKNPWTNPWLASDRLRTYVVMNDLMYKNKRDYDGDR